MTKLSAGEVCEIAGQPKSSLDRWVLFGLVEPENKNEGHGVHRRYNLSQTIAIAAAARYRREGAGFERIAGIIQYLSNLPIELLEAELEAGRTVPVPATMLGMKWLPGIMVEMPKDLPMNARKLAAKLDMSSIVAEVREKIHRLQHRKPVVRRGRRRVFARVA